MELSPSLYHKLVRPKWATNLYIHNLIRQHFNLREGHILDFGCGTGSNCLLSHPDRYLGIDPCTERIAFARNSYPNYTFQPLQEDTLTRLGTDTYHYVLIIAVLHHIPTHLLKEYLQEFKRILKPTGQILVIEPCLFSGSHLNNRFMQFFDKGRYIRSMNGYFSLFEQEKYQVRLLRKYKKMFFYNELFFSASV